MTTKEPQVREPQQITVNEVKPRRYGFNLTVKVLSAESSTAQSKTGEDYKVCEGLVGDATGSIKFRFTGDNATLIATKANKTVSFKNCSSTLFKRIIQLRLNKYGQIVDESTNLSEVNTENNLSKSELPKKSPEERRDGGYRQKEDVENEKRERREKREKRQKPKHPREEDKTQFITLDRLQPGVHGENVYVKVLSAQSDNLTRTKDNQVIYNCVGQCGDSTGVIKFRLTNDNARTAEKLVGKVIAFRNFKSYVFKGFHQIEMDRFSQITEESAVKIDKVNEANNLSSIEYEKQVKEPRENEGNGKKRNKKRRNQRSGSRDRDNSRRGGERSERRTEPRDNRRRDERSEGRRNDRSENRRDNRTEGRRDDREPRRENNRQRSTNEEGTTRRKRERRPSVPRVGETNVISLKDLRPGFNGSNVVVKIISATRSTMQRKDKTEVPVVTGICGDETAIIKYRVTGDFADQVEKAVNQVVSFNNCQSNVFKGFHDLGADKYSTITNETKVIKEIRKDNDLSSIEYEKKVVTKPEGERRSDNRRGGNNREESGRRGEGRGESRGESRGEGRREGRGEGRGNYNNNRRRRNADDDDEYRRDGGNNRNRYDREPRENQREPYQPFARQNK